MIRQAVFHRPGCIEIDAVMRAVRICPYGESSDEGSLASKTQQSWSYCTLLCRLYYDFLNILIRVSLLIVS